MFPIQNVDMLSIPSRSALPDGSPRFQQTLCHILRPAEWRWQRLAKPMVNSPVPHPASKTAFGSELSIIETTLRTRRLSYLSLQK
jgi:hypothetical protein